MIVEVSIPADLPPGHRLRIKGKFPPGSPSPGGTADVLTEDGEVTAGAVPPVGAPSLRGRFRQQRFGHQRLQFHREGGRLLNRHLQDARFDPRPVRRMETDDIRGFGTYTVSIQTINERGEESEGLASQTLFLAPAPLSVSDQQLSDYDVPTDVATFSCTHDTLR